MLRFVIVLLVFALIADLWIIRLLISEPERVMGQAERLRLLVPRCSHCGARQRFGTRMIAGRRAYICERCVRRAVELLDAPQDITRFL